MNLFLESLPSAYRDTLVAQMEEVPLPLRKRLYEHGLRPKYVHFMIEGVTSVVTFMEDGNGVEVGLIGGEGPVECYHLLGTAKVPMTGFVQVEGRALRLSMSKMQHEFDTSDVLHARVLEFAQVQSLVVTQIAACNRLHTVSERLARWLLMVQDRMQTDSFYLTQEFLAEMIGARRTTVTLAAVKLQRAGLIDYKRGKIRILDRQKLEGTTCECYPIVHDLILNLYRETLG